jgi:hypothetical protein
MANLDDLGFQSITSMNVDDALELIRIARLNRRTPVKPPKAPTTGKKAITAKSKTAKLDVNKLTEAERNELLKLLMGE